MADTKIQCYVLLDDKPYFDWTLYKKGDPYFTEKLDKYVALGNGIINSFAELDSKYLDDTFVPPYGSEIHVVPGCAVGMADVRKNYVIKRKADDGCCNVFSPLKDTSRNLWNNEYAIIPSKKAFVLSEKRYWAQNPTSNIKDDIKYFFPDIDFSDCTIVNGSLNVSAIQIAEDWIKLLKGEFSKPCISYKKLEFKTDNELTLDTLYLVYKTGIDTWSNDGQERFFIQLCALNEHNWRDYPGTLGVLMKDIMYRKYATCAEALGSPSRLPKAVKELARVGMSKQEFA